VSAADRVDAFVIGEDASIADAFRRLNENKAGTLFVAARDGRVVGVATDGDIRRRLLVDPDTRAPITAAMNRDFRFARAHTPREQVLKLLDARVRVVPCLDESGRLVDVFSRERFRLEAEGRLFARARAPTRISFGGGGTDLTAYFVEHTGVVLNAAITLHATASLRRLDGPAIRLYSHDFRESLALADAGGLGFDGRLDLLKAVIRVVDPGFGFELHVAADFPVGSGLGGSSTVAAAILGCFNQFREDRWDRHQIAELAFQAERLLLDIPGGWQDQYATVFGGVNFMEFAAEQNVILPLRLEPHVLRELEASLVLCWTGRSRDGGAIHRARRAGGIDDAGRAAAAAAKDVTIEMKKALLRGDLAAFGRLLDSGWRLKRATGRVSDAALDRVYETARASGAVGGKLLGAGGGGYFLFQAEPFRRYALEGALAAEGLAPRSFAFDDFGLQAWTVRAGGGAG
jgi:D-glycero-alpha-D-manno-heptose-7-phosphate kinase